MLQLAIASYSFHRALEAGQQDMFQYILDSQALGALRGAQGGGPTSEQVKQIADKAFVLRQGAWIDTTYTEGMKLVKLTFGSDDFFALLAARPQWGRYFAAGDKLTVVLDGIAYQVGDQAAPPLVIPAAATPTPTVERRTPAPTPSAIRTLSPSPSPTAARTPLAVTPVPSPAPVQPDPLQQFWQWLLALFGVK